MIIAAFLILFSFGGATFEHVIEQVKTHVADKQRAKQVIAFVEDAEQSVKDYQKQVQDIGEKVAALNRKYDTPEVEFDSVWAEALQYYDAVSGQLLDARFQMKSRMTRSEWAAVFKAP